MYRAVLSAVAVLLLFSSLKVNAFESYHADVGRGGPAVVTGGNSAAGSTAGRRLAEAATPKAPIAAGTTASDAPSALKLSPDSAAATVPGPSQTAAAATPTSSAAVQQQPQSSAAGSQNPQGPAQQQDDAGALPHLSSSDHPAAAAAAASSAAAASPVPGPKPQQQQQQQPQQQLQQSSRPPVPTVVQPAAPQQIVEVQQPAPGSTQAPPLQNQQQQQQLPKPQSQPEPEPQQRSVQKAQQRTLAVPAKQQQPQQQVLAQQGAVLPHLKRDQLPLQGTAAGGLSVAALPQNISPLPQGINPQRAVYRGAEEEDAVLLRGAQAATILGAAPSKGVDRRSSSANTEPGLTQNPRIRSGVQPLPNQEPPGTPHPDDSYVHFYKAPHAQHRGTTSSEKIQGQVQRRPQGDESSSNVIQGDVPATGSGTGSSKHSQSGGPSYFKPNMPGSNPKPQTTDKNLSDTPEEEDAEQAGEASNDTEADSSEDSLSEAEAAAPDSYSGTKDASDRDTNDHRSRHGGRAAKKSRKPGREQYLTDDDAETYSRDSRRHRNSKHEKEIEQEEDTEQDTDTQPEQYPNSEEVEPPSPEASSYGMPQFSSSKAARYAAMALKTEQKQIEATAKQAAKQQAQQASKPNSLATLAAHLMKGAAAKLASPLQAPTPKPEPPPPEYQQPRPPVLADDGYVSWEEYYAAPELYAGYDSYGNPDGYGSYGHPEQNTTTMITITEQYHKGPPPKNNKKGGLRPQSQKVIINMKDGHNSYDTSNGYGGYGGSDGYGGYGSSDDDGYEAGVESTGGRRAEMYARKEAPFDMESNFQPRRREARNVYNFRALPQSIKSSAGFTQGPGVPLMSTTANTPVIIYYETALTCGPQPGPPGGIGTCYGSGIMANPTARQLHTSWTCTIDADASSMCGLKYVQGMSITAQGPAQVWLTNGRVQRLQADVLPITGVYIPGRKNTVLSDVLTLLHGVKGGSLMLRADDDSAHFSFYFWR